VKAYRNCETKSLLEPNIGVTSLRTVRCGGRPNRYVEREAFSPHTACEKPKTKFDPAKPPCFSSPMSLFFFATENDQSAMSLLCQVA
jgi:hypothetical protein